MNELKRYAVSSDGRAFPDSSGNWVFHEDASRALTTLRAQFAAEREAHEKALAESEARYVAQTDALLKVEREAHARTLAALSAIWETAASGGSVADDTDWAAVYDAIAAAKVTP